MPLPRHPLISTYRAPAYRLGQRVDDEARGEVRIVGLSDAPIPWPLGAIRGGKSPALYAALVDAVRREAACAVAESWGVGISLVQKWRRAVGVTGTEGDQRLRVANGKANVKAVKAMHAKARDPGRRAKIAAAKCGKPRPAHVLAAMNQARLAKPTSNATRAKMSQAHKRRGTRPPAAGKTWTAWEEKLLAKLPPAEVAERTGRSLGAVYNRRSVLGLPDGRRTT